MQGFATSSFFATHRAPIAVSVIGHVALLAALSTSLVFMPSQPLQQLAIEAVVIDEGKMRRAAEAEQQKQAEAQRQEREQERQQQLEIQRREQEADAARRQEQQRREAEIEQQRKAAEAQAAERRAAEQRVAEERRVAEQKAAEERKRREAEASAQREADRKAAEARAKAEAERREQQRRQAELAAALAAEEELAAARSSGAMNRYITLIAQKVERNWVQPASAVAGVECEVSVQQLPNGEVISTRVTQCNGDEQVRASVERAVLAASPLPLPEDRLLFDRNLRFTFRPQVGN